jgi:hypothetical protein
MKFYLAKQVDAPSRLLTRKDEALKIDPTAEEIDIPTDKEGLRITIQDFFNHVHALEQQALTAPSSAPAVSTPAVPTKEPVKPGYAEWTVKIDDEFDNLPLGHKLHLACMALEEARKVLPHD